MTIQDFAPVYWKNTKTFREKINAFFADVMHGVSNWEWRILNSGRKVICLTDDAFSYEWSVSNKNTAIEAIQKLSEQTGVDYSTSIQNIENATPVSLRIVLPYELNKIMESAS